MTTTSPLDYLLDPLTPDEQAEFAQAVEYMGSLSGRIPEGSLGAMLARLSPNVQAAFRTLSDTVETPRTKPFDPKMSESDYADTFGFDADSMQAVKGQLDAEEVQARLLERMPDNTPDSPIDMRDQIAAAVDLYGDN